MESQLYRRIIQILTYIVFSAGRTLSALCSPGFGPDVDDFSIIELYNPLWGCVECPPGHWSWSGIWCNPCLRGTASNATGALLCAPCPKGTVAKAEGSTQCEPCRPGAYSSSNGRDCRPCPVGSYNLKSADLEGCIKCPAGTRGGPEKTSCLDCAPGWYQPRMGQNRCLKCKAGTFNDKYKQTSCIKCPAMHQTWHDGMTECVPCFYGMYTLVEGSKDCIECPAGTSKVAHEYGIGTTIDDICKPCPVGTYTFEPGTHGRCIYCPHGHYQNMTGQTSCVQCPVGTYQDRSRQGNCKPCSLDGQIPMPGQTTCQDCSSSQ